jgi:hypothetical protein
MHPLSGGRVGGISRTGPGCQPGRLLEMSGSKAETGRERWFPLTVGLTTPYQGTFNMRWLINLQEKWTRNIRVLDFIRPMAAL